MDCGAGAHRGRLDAIIAFWRGASGYSPNMRREQAISSVTVRFSMTLCSIFEMRLARMIAERE